MRHDDDGVGHMDTRLVNEHHPKVDELEIILAVHGEKVSVRPLDEILAEMMRAQDEMEWAAQKMSMLLVEVAALVRGERTVPA
jgi:hypothetical protein